MADDDFTAEPSLKNVLEQDSLRWVFVGGKGGVGKTTTSCSLAIQLSQQREKVLLISTDPAHNLSDAFSQKLTGSPTLINGFSNLYAMEVDPTPELKKVPMMEEMMSGAMRSMIETTILALPGLDELVSLFHLMRLVEKMNYSTVVFDTAPTGHTLRLLSSPLAAEKFFENLEGVPLLSTMMSQLPEMTGLPGMEAMDMNLLKEKKEMIREIQATLTNPDKTTFICVCIAEFLPVYETERLVQELLKLKIDCHNIVVNQLLSSQQGKDCAYCSSRLKMQRKYLGEINELYEGLHITKVPMQLKEVRGKDDLISFSKLFLTPASIE